MFYITGGTISNIFLNTFTTEIHNAKITGGEFSRVQIYNSKVSGGHFINGTRFYDDCDISGGDIDYCRFENIKYIAGGNLSMCQLSNMSIMGGSYHGCSFKDCHFINGSTALNRCQLYGKTIGILQEENLEFIKCEITEYIISSGKFNDCIAMKCIIKGGNFIDGRVLLSTIKDGNFKNVDISSNSTIEGGHIEK